MRADDPKLKRLVSEQGSREEILAGFQRVETTFPKNRGVDQPPTSRSRPKARAR